jgi:NADPH:quinone reductase-like Zn-dependent oxidoreductase
MNIVTIVFSPASCPAFLIEGERETSESSKAVHLLRRGSDKEGTTMNARKTTDRAPMSSEKADTFESSAPKETTMRAVLRDTYGSVDVLRLGVIDKPVIADDEVLVKVRAAGLDRGTWHHMTGLPYLGRLAFGLRAPKNPVLGLDVAGTIVAVGSRVTRFQHGDEVFGIAKGSFAEFAAAKENKLAPKPAGLSFEQAAVVPVSALTALQALRDAGRVKAGWRVLVVGASGGVGTYAVQLARSFRAEVTGVASTPKIDLVRSIGADHVIDYTREDFADGIHRYDLILDIGGNSPLSRLRRALTPTGTLVIVGGEHGGKWTGVNRQLRALALSPFIHQRLTTFISKERHADLETISQLIESGHVAPVIDEAYALADVTDAMRRLHAGHARGKIVITI